jgi:hypothetical protein
MAQSCPSSHSPHCPDIVQRLRHTPAALIGSSSRAVGSSTHASFIAQSAIVRQNEEQ